MISYVLPTIEGHRDRRFTKSAAPFIRYMTPRPIVHRHPKLPQQTRSQRTRERLVCAAEYLLSVHGFDVVTVEAVAEHANASVATFYKHFPRKQDLLPPLLARLRAAAEAGSGGVMARPAGVGASLATRVAWIVRHVASATTFRRNVLRACVAARNLRDPALGPELLDGLRREIRDSQRWLLECRTEIKHPDPTIAVRLGFFLTLQSLQAALLHEQPPEDLTEETIILEAERLLMRYLTAGKDVHADDRLPM